MHGLKIKNNVAINLLTIMFLNLNMEEGVVTDKV